MLRKLYFLIFGVLYMNTRRPYDFVNNKKIERYNPISVLVIVAK